MRKSAPNPADVFVHRQHGIAIIWRARTARRLIAAATVLALLAASLSNPPAAHAAFTATLVGTTATLNGNVDSETLFIGLDPSGTLLQHNLSAYPGFKSVKDWDTTQAGDQTLAAAAGSVVNINAGGGDDLIRIGNIGAAPARLMAHFNINGDVGNDTVVYEESADTAARNIVVTNNQVSISPGIPGPSIALVTYTQVEKVIVNGGRRKDTINVQSTAATTLVVIDNQVNDPGVIDTVSVGNAGNTQNVLGAVDVHSQGFATYVRVDDSADPTGRNIQIGDNAINGVAPATISFIQTDLISMTVKGGNGGNTFNISSVSKTLPKSLTSGSGNDTFVFAKDATLTGAGRIDGGAGVDTLDYSAYTTPVTVDAGSATNTGGITNIEKVIGGSGNDNLFGRSGVNSILKGGPGNDMLHGGDGNDTLIGDTGNDTLIGGAGSDTLIWNDGDGNDTIDGNAGSDTVQVNGSSTAGDAFTINPNAARISFARTNLVPFTLNISTTERLVVNSGDGDDSLTADANLPGLTAITMNGGNGNDTVQVNGSATADDTFSVAPNGARFTIDHSSPVSSTFDIGTTELAALKSDGGDDTFNVIPLFATGIAIDGGPHRSGDVLNFNRQGLPASRVGNTISVPGRRPVTYTQIEKVNIVSIGSSPGVALFLPLIRRSA